MAGVEEDFGLWDSYFWSGGIACFLMPTVSCVCVALVPVNTCIIALLHVDKWCSLFGLES